MKIANNISLAIIGIVIFIFLFITIKYSPDSPFTLDDSRIFISTYITEYLSSDRIIDKISFFFSKTIYPHTKLVGRLINHLLFIVTGELQFKWLIIIGSIVKVIFVLFSGNFIQHQLKYLILIPLAALLFSPYYNSIWIGPIAGYPYLFLFVLLNCYLIKKDKYLASSVTCFICSFTHTPGLLIFPLSILLILATKKQPLKLILLYSSIFVATFLLYKYMVLDTRRGFSSRNIVLYPSSFDELLSMLTYVRDFIHIPFKSVAPKFVSTIVACITVILSIHSLLTYKKSKDVHVFLFFLFTCFTPVLSCLMNDDKSTLFDTAAPRYEMYALYFWFGLYLFIAVNYLNKYTSILLFSLFCLYGIRNVKNNLNFPSFVEAREYKWTYKYLVDQNKNFVKKSESEIVSKAISYGMLKSRNKIKLIKDKNFLNYFESENPGDKFYWTKEKYETHNNYTLMASCDSKLHAYMEKPNSLFKYNLVKVSYKQTVRLLKTINPDKMFLIDNPCAYHLTIEKTTLDEKVYIVINNETKHLLK